MSDKSIPRMAMFLVGCAAIAFAHHSFTSAFDGAKPITVTGTITKFEWTNPHIWFFIDVKEASGNAANWAFEGAAPAMLMRRGVTRHSLKVGDVITVEGFRAKDGTRTAAGTYVAFSDGKRLFTGALGAPSK
jgi:hypothetical protein